jgi:hypothetical protein
LVSMTTSTSSPAVNPGPKAITNGAWSILVPKLRLAKIASTITVGER